MSTINIWCWIIPLLVGLICAYFGYLIGKAKQPATTETVSVNIQQLKTENTQLKNDLALCKKQLATDTHIEPIISIAAETIAAYTFNAELAQQAFGKKIKENDLKIVEGIGPKIEALFNADQITTWEALSDLSVAECQAVLDKGGDRYRIHDPASWPMQAKMAFTNKWKDLVRWQKEHKSGKI